MTDVSHKSPFDDIAFLDPLQSPHPVQSNAPTPTSLTPTHAHYQMSNSRGRQLSPQKPLSDSPATKTSSSMAAAPSATKEQQSHRDTFAALVAPPSPLKASTFTSMTPQDRERGLFDQLTHVQSHTTTNRPLHRRTESVSSQQSDFGAFVSVSSSEDPLSANIWDFDEQVPPTPAPETPTTATLANSSKNAPHPANEQEAVSQPSSSSSLPPPPKSYSRSSSSSASAHTPAKSSQNTSTPSFFDQFAHDAKERTQARSSLLLNELLLHQDDPLYFLQDQKAADTSAKKVSEPGLGTAPPPVSPPSLLSPPLIPLPSSNSVPSPLAPVPITPTESLPLTPEDSSASPQPQKDHPRSLLDIDLNDDLDHDYFRVAASSSQANISIPQKQSHHLSHLRTPPTRSSSIPVPVPTLAPPVESPEGAVSSQPRSPPTAASYVVSHHLATSPSAAAADGNPGISSNFPHKDGTVEDGSAPKLKTRRSFTSLPGKWVSTLLRSAPVPGQSAAQTSPAKPSIESVFGAGSSADGEMSTSPAGSTSPLPSGSARSTNLGPEQPTLHRRSSTSPSRKRPPQQPTFTHSNPFAPPSQPASVIHGPSPFAPHVYIPPTGAPGFTGEQYTWDKGFSEELEAERERERGRKELRPAPHTNVKAKTVPGVGKENEPEESTSRGSSVSGSKASSSGWGSGFGFSFGTIRGGGGNGKSKLAPSTSSGSGSRISPSSSFVASNGSMKAPSTHSTESESDRSSFFAHERAVSSPPPMRQSEDPKASAVEPGAGGVQKGIEGIGAFIERKSGNIELLGRKAATTPVLTTELASLIRPHLPALSRLPRSWTLIYSLDQDGISLNTLYTRCEAHATRRPAPGEVLANNAAMLVVMRDADGGLFGAWVAEGVRLNKGGKGYFGGGESFLWKYHDHELKVFKCTGKNNYIALCEPEYISFGGGDGHYGLYLDESLFDGSSAPCPTFNNEPLCSPGPRKGASVTFECVGLEVWGMGP